MLDIKIVRNDPDRVKAAVRKRNKNMDKQIDEVLQIDEQRRALNTKTDNLKAEQNKASKMIPSYKKEGKDVTEIMDKLRTVSDEISVLDREIAELEEKQKIILLSIPNIPHESVPEGKDDEDNTEIRRIGTPREFPYEPKAHWDIGTNLGILDFERGVKVTGKRFTFYKGLGARLERSVINFFLNTHTSRGYTEMLTPLMANKDSMTGTGQLPKFADDMFKIENTDYYMIPTAEVPVTNYHREEILDGNKLPEKYCAYSACFRAEAGSAGRDTRGIIRQHQFNKVELVKFVTPETSYDELEKLTADAEYLLQQLGLPYRVVKLCAGDLGFSSAKTYDIEVWMPSYEKYVEISSCSNFEDYQARRAGIRFKNGPKEKAKFVHTLNGSGLAVGRTVAAILENYQNGDGSITVPQVLKPYMGVDEIKPAK